MTGWSFPTRNFPTPPSLPTSLARFTRRTKKSSNSSNSSSSSSPEQKSSSLKLYANLVSQPSRSVAWALKVKGVNYELVTVDFKEEFIKSDEFKALNPNALVPVLRDGDFSLFEGNAILTYLAVKLGWTDMYPTDIQIRAKVDEFLHWHHTNTRLFTIQIMRPAIARASGVAKPSDLVFLDNADALIEKELTLLETFLVKDFIAHTDVPTVADYAAYSEIDQLEMIGYDLAKYPKVTAWIARMKEIPFHDEIREDLDKFLTNLGIRVETDKP